MKILLDENLNWRLARYLPGHTCASVPRIGWAGVKNGMLLQQAADAGFEVLLKQAKWLHPAIGILPMAHAEDEHD